MTIRDRGEQFPGANPTIRDVHEGMAQSNRSTRPGSILATLLRGGVAEDSTSEVNQYVVASESDEAVYGYRVSLSGIIEAIDTTLTAIAKPPELRKSTYDATEDGDGFTLAHNAASRRSLVRNNLTRYEVITPAYTSGDRIFAAESGSTGVLGVGAVDLNLATRRWESEEPEEKWFQVTAVYKDVLVCQEWDWTVTPSAQKRDATGTLLPAVNVAKPIELRGTEWSTLLISGVTYTSTDGTAETSGHTTRDGVGTVTENQLIITPYILSTTKILAERMDLGTGAVHGSVEALWQDKNQGARAWAEAFA